MHPIVLKMQGHNIPCLVYSNFHLQGGEWSPSLDPRTDLAKYGTAVATMRNFFPHAHGGASNRPGTDYVGNYKNMSKVARFVRFQFSVVQSYLLVFEDLFIRFVKDGGMITLTDQVITGITKANPAVVTYTGADTYANGDKVIISGVVGMLEVNNREFTVANVNTGANTFELSGVNSTAYTTYASGGVVSEIYQVATPYIEADLALLKFTQSADTLYITHPSYARRKLTRTAHTSWTLSTITAGSIVGTPVGLSCAGTGKFFVVTALNSDGVESGISAEEEGDVSNTLSWTAVSLATEYNIYYKVNGIYKNIGRSGTNSFPVPATLDPDDDLAGPTTIDPFNSAGAYPGCSVFNKQRLVFARTNNEPQTLWGSRIGDFQNNNISSPLQNDDAYKLTIPSTQVNEIKWMETLNQLIIGTSGEEFKLDVGTDNSPSSQKVDFQSAWGASDVPPLKIGTSLLFVDGSLRKVRDLTFSFTIDGYDGSDLTVLAQHLFETHQIKEWAYARQPDSIVWCVRTDGVLCGLTYLKEHQVVGWFTADTSGTYETVAAIQTSGGTTDVYFGVKRTVNSQTVRYIERLHERDFTTIEDAYFVDCGLTYDSTPATVISGLGHLEGKEVVCLADGNVVTGLTVSNGKITLPNAASTVQVGLAYTCQLGTLGFDYPSRDGTIQNKVRDITEITVKLRNTREMFAGPDADTLSETKFRTNEDYGDPTALFTGSKTVTILPTDATDARVFIETRNPLPITVAAIIPVVNAGDIP
jgi:hypothetical protein